MMPETDLSTESTEITSTEELVEVPDELDAEPEKVPTAEESVRAALDMIAPKEESEAPATPEAPKTPKVDPKVARESLFGDKKPQRGPKRTVVGQEQTAKAPAEPLVPPAFLKTEEKEKFHNWPDDAKRSFNEMTKNLQGHATKVLQNANRWAGEAKEVVEAVKPYMAEWDLKGASVGQAIKQICAAQKYLVDNREYGIATLIDTMGIDRAAMIRVLSGQQGGSQGQPQQYQQPQADPRLTQELNELKNWKQSIEQQQTYQQQAQVQALGGEIANQVEVLRNERGPDGRFIHPRLHEPQFLKAIEPLVEAVQKTNPELAWGEVYRRVYHMAIGSPSSPQPRLSQPVSNINAVQRAKASSISLRGRGGAAQDGGFDDKHLPRKTEDSVRAAYEYLSRE